MLTLLSRIPVQSQKPIARGLLMVATLALLFGFLFVLGFQENAIKEECTGRLFFKKCVDKPVPISDRLSELLTAIALIGGAFACVYAALRLTTMQGHLQRYQAILTGEESMSIQRIAEITDSRSSKVRTEIQSMIDSHMISDFYIDYQNDQVVSRKYIPKTSRKTVVKCSGCGGNNELIVGITKPCNYCGEPLLLGKF